jgi:hypothetical protein
MNAPSVLAPADRFLACLAEAERRETPFRHWLLADVLPAPLARAIAALPIPPAKIDDTKGKRETHNSTRRFFAEGDLATPVTRAVAEAFQGAGVVRALAETTGAELAGTSLRIEYCRDTDGFWLEPQNPSRCSFTCPTTRRLRAGGPTSTTRKSAMWARRPAASTRA